MTRKRSREWVEGYAASLHGVSLSRNPYLAEATVEDPDDMKLVIANNRYIDWREGWKAKFHGE